MILYIVNFVFLDSKIKTKDSLTNGSVYYII